MSAKVKIEEALKLASKKRNSAHSSHVDFCAGRISAYEHCLELLDEYEKTEDKAKSALEAAAVAVIDLERERVNTGGGEPYDPIANPGYFDPRIVDLATFVWEPGDAAAAIGTPCPNPAGNPTSLRESVGMLDAVYGFLRSFQSTQIKNSRKWHAANQSCIAINNAVKLIEQIPRSSTEQIGTPCPKPDLHNEKLQTEIAILRKGLEDIIQHQDIIGGKMSRHSAVRYIAHKALMESKDATE